MNIFFNQGGRYELHIGSIHARFVCEYRSAMDKPDPDLGRSGRLRKKMRNKGASKTPTLRDIG